MKRVQAAVVIGRVKDGADAMFTHHPKYYYYRAEVHLALFYSSVG